MDYKVAKHLQRICSNYDLKWKYNSKSNMWTVVGKFTVVFSDVSKTLRLSGTSSFIPYKDINQITSLALGNKGKLFRGVIPEKRKNLKNKRMALWNQGHTQCFVCGTKIKTYEESSVEHIVPRCLGGTNKITNLALSHEKCNRRRGPKLNVNPL